MQLTQRNINILKIIVEEFIQTWEVIWSKSLLKKYDLWVSSATVRNDMAILEQLDLIYQPYASAWRLPTTKWLRAFINYLMSETPKHFLEPKSYNVKNNDIKTFEDFVYNLVYELSKKTKEIVFFVSKQDSIVEYNWVSSFLENNYKMLWNSIFSIIKMLEDKFNFINFIENFPITNEINVFIWEENILNFFKDYTIILRPISMNWNICYIWIIWSLKMNYSFNISAIKWII